ncbi:hypothetical protein, partial [Pseudomonas aeruginosa]|uniref:hypothetical protein n=2 Tax=Pseudomonas aeruginosa group TaxID=136841 RepID=UPI001BAF5B47
CATSCTLLCKKLHSRFQATKDKAHSNPCTAFPEVIHQKVAHQRQYSPDEKRLQRSFRKSRFADRIALDRRPRLPLPASPSRQRSSSHFCAHPADRDIDEALSSEGAPGSPPAAWQSSDLLAASNAEHTLPSKRRAAAHASDLDDAPPRER